MTSNEISTLKTGKYSIEFSGSGTAIFAQNEDGEKKWIATTTDPAQAMVIVEGLIMVEHKRFYHPETIPVLKDAENKPLPPFLKRGVEKSQGRV